MTDQLTPFTDIQKAVIRRSLAARDRQLSDAVGLIKRLNADLRTAWGFAAGLMIAATVGTTTDAIEAFGEGRSAAGWALVVVAGLSGTVCGYALREAREAARWVRLYATTDTTEEKP